MPGRAKPGQPKSQAKQVIGKRVGRGAGKGDGWGGPAKGEGGAKYRKGEVQPLQGKALTAPVVEAREERLTMLRDRLWQLAFTAEREETQLAATNAYLDREEGKAIARSVTTAVDDVSQLTDLELTAEIARLQRELGQGAKGSGEAEAGKQAIGVPPVH